MKKSKAEILLVGGTRHGQYVTVTLDPLPPHEYYFNDDECYELQRLRPLSGMRSGLYYYRIRISG